MNLQQIITGNCLEVLPTLEEGSVQVCCTSPPYYAVRDYGTEPVVWGGDPNCAHEFGPEQPGHIARFGGKDSLSAKQTSNRGTEALVGAAPRSGGQFCQKCGCCEEHCWKPLHVYNPSPQRTGDEGIGFDDVDKTRAQRWRHSEACFPCGAWKGELGQEPTSDLYIQHLVQVFREVRRVLHPTGLLFLNLGDSRAGSGKGRMKDGTHSKEHGTKQGTNVGTLEGTLTKTSAERAPRSPLGIPDRVKEALVADGWILVSAICLCKKNPMTSPARGPRWVNCYKKVKKSTLEGSGKQAEVGGTYAGFNERYRGEDDAVWMRCPGCKKCEPNGGRILKKGGGRPTDAYEMLYVLAKSQDYFWNTEGVRRQAAEVSRPQTARAAELAQQKGLTPAHFAAIRAVGLSDTGKGKEIQVGSGKNDPAVVRLAEEAAQALGGYYREFLSSGSGGNALNWIQWKPAPLSDKHYAAFPPFLPTWCLDAGCPEWCCAKCGTYYAPVIDGDTHDEEASEDREWQKACGGDDEGEYRGEAQKDYEENGAQNASDVKRRILAGMKKRTVVDWWPTCKCEAAHEWPEGEGIVKDNCVHCGVPHLDWSFDIEGVYDRCRRKPVVLDPFLGSGTTLKVAREKGLPGIGVDAQPDYAPIAHRRLAEVAA